MKTDINLAISLYINFLGAILQLPWWRKLVAKLFIVYSRKKSSIIVIIIITIIIALVGSSFCSASLWCWRLLLLLVVIINLYGYLGSLHWEMIESNNIYWIESKRVEESEFNIVMWQASEGEERRGEEKEEEEEMTAITLGTDTLLWWWEKTTQGTYTRWSTFISSTN